MTDEFDRAKDLFRWNERIFNYLGVWPLHSTYGWFTVCSIYYVAHIIMESIDLYSVLGDFELMVTNLSESTLQVMIFVKMLRLRFMEKVPTVLERVMDVIDTRCFESTQEGEIYLNYNRMAKTFFKLWVWMGVASAFGYWLKPMQIRYQAAQEGESAPFVLAYRVHLFFEVNDTTTFYLAWIYQAPVMYFGIWHTSAIGLLFSLVLHVCGLLAVLSFRIRNLNVSDRKNDEAFRTFFENVLKKHRDILECVSISALGLNLCIKNVMIFFYSTYRLTKDINDMFGLILLEELLLTTVLIGLTCYAALRSVDAEDATQFISFIIYGFTLLLLLYGYCVAGEYLITESTNLYTAYYQCMWYDMPGSSKKQLVICMIGASKPIQLTAGGIYTFCLFNFVGIVKSAAGYISMLRNMI